MFILYLLSDPIKALGFILGLILGITIHEFMHAYSSFRLGDPTAKAYGRVSLNPLVHLDPFGTLFLLFVGFGWGKPVPVDPSNFNNPRVGEAISSIAGPFANFILAALLSILVRFLPLSSASTILNIIIYINLILCVFNLLPIPPLDGSKLLWAIYPKIDLVAFERIGMPILFGIILLSYVTGYSILGRIILPVINFLAHLLGAGSI